MRRRLAAEVFGTFCLVFAGTGAIVANDASGGAVTHVGVALMFGLVVVVLAYSLGDVSGCHLNPAVTLGLCAARRFSWRDSPGYLAAQCLGAVSASLFLRALFPEHPTLGVTLPSGPAGQSWALECALTLMLVFVILSVSAAPGLARLTGAAAGAVVALEALFAGPICGASMNPARSLGPALVSGRLEYLWVYLTAPLAGALAGVLTCGLIRGPKCCGQPCPERDAP